MAMNEKPKRIDDQQFVVVIAIEAIQDAASGEQAGDKQHHPGINVR